MPAWRDETAARAKEMKAGASYSPEVGDNAFRIMPNKKGPKFPPYTEFRIHRKVGPEKVWVRCGKSIRGEGADWLCDKALPTYEESASETKRAMAKEMQAGEVLLLQVSPIDAKTGKFMAPKPWWVTAKSLRAAIMTRLGDLRHGAIDDPINGRNLTVERTGTGMKTRYQLMLDDDKSEVPKAILAQIKPMEELTPKYDAKRQMAAWKGERYEGGEAEPPADEPAGEPGNDADYTLDEPTVEESVDDEPPLEGDEELPAEGDKEYALEGDDLPADDEVPADEFEPEPESEPEPAPVPRRAAPRPAAPPAGRPAAAASARRTPPPARPAARPAAPPAGRPKPRR